MISIQQVAGENWKTIHIKKYHMRNQWIEGQQIKGSGRLLIRLKVAHKWVSFQYIYIHPEKVYRSIIYIWYKMENKSNLILIYMLYAKSLLGNFFKHFIVPVRAIYRNVAMRQNLGIKWAVLTVKVNSNSVELRSGGRLHPPTHFQTFIPCKLNIMAIKVEFILPIK